MPTTAEISAQTAPELLIDHNLTDAPMDAGVLFEMRPARTPDGEEVDGLFNAWITLNNPAQFNSYTTEMVKSVILAFRAASNARDVACVVRNITQATHRNIASTCACLTTWSALF